MTWKDKRPTLAGVLRYVRARERQARLRNDRWARLNWEEVELLQLDAVYGVEPQSHRFRKPARVVVAPEPRRKTQGHKDMMARPLRKVVRIHRAALLPLMSGYETPTYREHLECGHTVLNYIYRPGDPIPKRRRCEDCRSEMAEQRHPKEMAMAQSVRVSVTTRTPSKVIPFQRVSA